MYKNYKQLIIRGLFQILLAMLAGVALPTTVDSATGGTLRFYLHAEPSEENATYGSMLPSVQPEGTTQDLGTDNSTQNWGGTPPCEAAGFTYPDNSPSVNEETDSAERCVATFYSPIVGGTMQIDNTDTNSIDYSLWATEEGNCTTCVLRARLYEYVEPGGTFNLIDTSDSAAVTAGALTNITWSSTPDTTTTVNPGNRLVLAVTMYTGTGEDTSGTNPDTINVNFDRLTNSPAFVELDYTMTTADKPNLGSAMDDDFNVSNGCGATCDATTISLWTMETSGNTATESVSIHESAATGSSHWMALTDVKTADLAPTSLANYTYIYQPVLSGDGSISTQVSSSHATYPTTDPRDLAGLLMRFSVNTNFLILQTYYDGANNVVEVNDSGVLTGTTATITGNANNILLKWVKSGTNYQAQYCTSDTTDCTVDGNWTNLGAAVAKVGVTLDQVGLTSFVEWVTGTNIRYTSAFEWFDSTFQRLYVWDGGGGNANWNTAANWTNDTTPGVNNIAIFDGTCAANCSPTVNVDPNVSGINIKSSYAGTITQSNGIDMTLGTNGYVQSGGTFTGGNSDITVNGNWTFSGGTFNPNSTTVVFGPNGLLVDSGTMSFNNVTFDTAGDVTISGSMDINGTLTLENTNQLLGDAITLAGNLVTTDISGGNDDATVYFNGGGNQTVSVDGAGGVGMVPSVVINKSTGTLTIQDTINVISDWTYIAGTVDAGTSTVNFTGGSKTINPGSMSFNHVQFDTGGNITISGTLDINGSFTIETANIVDGGALTVAGNFIHNYATMSTPRSTDFILDGSNNQTISAVASADWQDTALTINKTGGTVTLASDVSLDGPFGLQNLIITSGTLDQGSTYNLTTADLTIGGSGVLYNTGTGDLTLGGDVTNTGTILLDGSGIGCGDANSITVQSNTPGVARSWSGGGQFEIQDVTVTDQTGSVIAYSSTQGSGATWTFINTCPDKVWDGGGIDGTCGGAGTANNWSCADNWTDDTVPIATDTVLFMSLSTKNADIDTNITVEGIEITSGYTGTITQESGNTITLGADGYVHSTGTFIGGDSNIDVNGTFDLSGGSFLNTSDSLNVSGNFTITSTGTFNNDNGRLILDGDLFFTDSTAPQQDLGDLVIGSSPDTTTLTTDLTASSLTIDGADVLITDGYNVIISGTVDINGVLTATNGSGGNTTIYVGGAWDATGGTFTSTSSTVVFTGTDSHTITSDTKAFNNITFNSSLLAYWKFDEAAYNATVIDHTGNGYNGTPSGATGSNIAPTPTKTRPPLDFTNLYAKDFDATDDVIDFGQVNEIENVSALTLTAWVRRRAAGSIIFIGKQETGTQDDINIELWSDGNINFAVSDNGFASGSVALNDTNWHHVALVFDGTLTGNANRVKGFVDGVQQVLSFAGTVPAQTPAMVTSFVVGEDGQGGGDFADGFVDDVRVYTRVLTTAEVQQLAAGNPGSGIYILEDTLDVNGTLMMVSGTLDVKNGENNLVNVAGNWLAYSDFNARSGTVTLDGTTQTISGSTTFYNLEKEDTTNNATDVTLTVSAGTTQTIQNSLSLTGLDSDDRVNLLSSSAGVRYRLNVPNSSQNVSWTDVSGSEALGNDIIATDSIDSGNNDDAEPAPHWDFSGADELIGCFNKSNLNHSINATEQDILELDAGCFENGNTYLMFGGIGGMRWDDAAMRLETGLAINSSTSHIAGHEEFQEGPAADRGSSHFTLGRRTWGTNETLDLVGQRITGPGNGDADETFLMGMDTASMGVENLDWFWNENTAVSGLPTALGTTYAQITFTPDGTSDYLVIANMRATIDTAEEEVEMDIYDGTTPLSRHIRDSEDVADEQQMFAATLLEAPAASPITLSVRARTSTAATVADHHSSRLLIIRLDYYDAHSCQEVDENVAMTTSYVVRATTNLALNTSGDVIVFGYGYFSSTNGASEVSARLRQDTTTLYQITNADPADADGRNGIWQTSDFMPTMWFDIVPAVDTNSHTYDFSYVRSGTVGANSIKAMVCAWSRKIALPYGFTWSGAGNWSTGANWLGGVPPGISDVARFNATSTNNSTIDTDISVGGITINSGYTGTITQGSGNTATFGASGFSQSAGVFLGGDSNIDVNGTFTLSAGSFTTTTGTMGVSGNFILSSTGTFNNPDGTLIFDGDLYFADSTSPQQNIGKLVIGQSPDTTTLTTDMTADSLKIMSGDALITDGYEIILTGTMDINGLLNAANGSDGRSTLRVGGVWDMTGGTFTNTNSTVMFTGTSSALTITSDTKSFNNVTINDGLVGYWKLDESASPAADYSGYGNNAVWQGNATVSTTQVSGTINFNNPGSIDLDGTNDYLEVQDSNVLDLSGTGPFTFTAWIYPESFGESNNGRIIDHGGGSGLDGGWSFLVDDLGAGDQLTVYLESPGVSETYRSNANAVTLNEWQHVAAIREGATITFYVNGVNAGSATNTNLNIADSADPVRIGIRASDLNRDFNGFIDEVRVYNRTLTATEIAAMANGNMPGVNRVTYTLQDNLDVNGTLTINAGELHTGSNRDINVGRSWMNHGGIFTANSGDVFFDGASSAALILSGSQTFYNVDITGSGMWTLQDNAPVSSVFDVSAGTLTYSTNTIIEPINIVGNTTITGGTFTGQSTRFRHDGNITISSGTYTAPTDVLEITGSFAHTGGSFSNSGSTVMFAGTDNHTINTSGGTTFQDVIVNDGLLGYWKLDETAESSNSACSSTATFDDSCDSSGYGHHGEWVITPVVSTSVPDTHYHNPASLDIDDASLEYVDITDHDRFDLDVAGKYTWTVWINSDDLTAGGGWPTLWSQTININNFFYFYAQTLAAGSGTTGGSITNGIAVWWSSTAGSIVTEAENVVSTGVWYHIAVTYDGSLAQASRIRIYVNGQNVTGGTVSAGAISSLAPTDVRIGSNEPFPSDNYDGKIDEMRFYNRLLSTTEIQALADGNMPGTGLGTYTLQTNLNVDGTLRLNTGTLDVSGSNRQINVGGDWENFGGVFNAQTGTVVFDGTDQQIPASETFYNLNKTLSASPSRTLTFGRQSTVTISNTLTLQGFDSSSKLNLRSSSVGTRFNLDVPGGVQTVNRVDVQDSEALSNNIRANNSTDSGNTDRQEAEPHWIIGPLRGAVMIVD